MSANANIHEFSLGTESWTAERDRSDLAHCTNKCWVAIPGRGQSLAAITITMDYGNTHKTKYSNQADK